MPVSTDIKDFPLGHSGFQFSDLYNPLRLKDLHRISSVVFEIVGTERVERDSETRFEATFYRKIISEKAVPPSGFMGGRESFTFPSDTIPSFKSTHHQIEWGLLVKGTAKRGPDMQELFPFTIHSAGEVTDA